MPFNVSLHDWEGNVHSRLVKLAGDRKDGVAIQSGDERAGEQSDPRCFVTALPLHRAGFRQREHTCPGARARAQRSSRTALATRAPGQEVSTCGCGKEASDARMTPREVFAGLRPSPCSRKRMLESPRKDSRAGGNGPARGPHRAGRWPDDGTLCLCWRKRWALPRSSIELRKAEQAAVAGSQSQAQDLGAWRGGEFTMPLGS